MAYPAFNNPNHHLPPPSSLTLTELIAICMAEDLIVTAHAKTRAAQRNFAYDEINFIVKYGRPVRRTGTIFCQMLHKCIPVVVPANHPYRRLVGSTVVLCSCGGHVITLYRNERSFKADASKAKYRQGQGETIYCDQCGSDLMM